MSEEKRWSEFLSELTKDLPDGTMRTIEVGGITIQINKSRDTLRMLTFSVGITRGGEEPACEQYWLEENWGVFDSFNVYPCLVEKPPAITTKANELQRKDYAEAYANNVVTFLRNLLVAAVLEA